MLREYGRKERQDGICKSKNSRCLKNVNKNYIPVTIMLGYLINGKHSR